MSLALFLRSAPESMMAWQDKAGVYPSMAVTGSPTAPLQQACARAEVARWRGPRWKVKVLPGGTWLPIMVTWSFLARTCSAVRENFTFTVQPSQLGVCRHFRVTCQTFLPAAQFSVSGFISARSSGRYLCACIARACVGISGCTPALAHQRVNVLAALGGYSNSTCRLDVPMSALGWCWIVTNVSSVLHLACPPNSGYPGPSLGWFSMKVLIPQP
jgi:hypothetical protein